ncbi:hypothetical protein [Luteipulveratus halotolerans]|uniref:hypothetical protein n=1 Tax=Luteipulveratus halotolerans TaxID=1631356 RepID=UPI000680B0C6|nr:hypothetical protein [Luteipulveratus halotolerans]
MPRTRNRAARAAVVSLALAGALGLSACQEDSPTAAEPTSAAPTSSAAAEPTSEAPSSEAPTTEATSEAPSTTAAPSASTSAPAGGPVGDTTLTPEGTTLKFGQPAVVKEGSGDSADTYRLSATALEVAPDSVYTSENLNKANGKVYYLRYKATNIGKSGATWGASDVNSFMFIPKLSPDQKGKKLIGSIDACDTPSDDIPVGGTGDGCEVYQITGNTVTDVIFRAGDSRVVWTK